MQSDLFLDVPRVKGTLSIDRVTFLLWSPSLSLWCEKQDELRNENKVNALSDLIKSEFDHLLDEDFVQGFPSRLFRCHFHTKDDIDIQFGSQFPRRIKLDDEYIQAFGADSDDEKAKFVCLPNEYAFRVEYNPNNTNLSSICKLLEFVTRFSVGSQTIRIVRLDIAIDFPASIVPELVLCDGMRKSFTASGSKGIESIYFGTRQSKNYFRLYDKRQERMDKENIDIGHDLWRLELEAKSGFFLDSVPDFGSVFKRFAFYSNDAVSSGDWKFDLLRSQAMLYGLQNVLRRLPKNTAFKYRKMFKAAEGSHLIESPAAVFYRDFPFAMEKLTVELFTSCGIKMWEH